MRRESRKHQWRVGALASGLLTATAWAQAQPPLVAVPPSGPAPVMAGPPAGDCLSPRDARKKWFCDTFIGRPGDFAEPPVGFYVRENLGLMKAKADPHRFTLYRTDFLDGSDRLSPIGSTRFNLMAARLSGWLGPIVVEWSPDHPGLSEARRTAVLATLQQAGLPVIPERVVIGPSPYPGGMGVDGVLYYNNLLTRDGGAGANYSLSPVSSSGFGFGGGGGAP